MIKHELNNEIPLIGFSGSPWTLACYMIQGQGSKDFAKAKQMLFNEPTSMTLLLEKLTHHITCYLNAQIEAGADALMLFDTWGGLLSTQDYQFFSLNFMNKIMDNLKPNLQGEQVPLIMFTKGGGQWLESMAQTKAQGLGLDWTVDIKQAFNRVGDKVALQGNLDPSILLASPDVVEQKAKELLAAVDGKAGHIFNLGHGITPNVPVENMQVLVDTVHNFS
jgi:uroporphyrinogen decarboxylase